MVNLFIAGGVKCGTTWLYDELSKYNDFHCPSLKEPQFFNDSYKKRKHIQQITTLKEYERRIEKATDEKYLVDGTAAYLGFSEIPEKIKKYNKHAKIIVLLRHPVRRAYSHYLMDMREGLVNCSFEEALETDCKTDEFGYLRHSKYYDGLKLFREMFDDQLIVFPFSYIKKPEVIFKELSEFLNVKFTDLDIGDEKKNSAAVPTSKLSRLLLQSDNFRFISKVFPRSMRSFVKKNILTKKVNVGLDNDAVLRLYSIYFKEDSDKLFKLENRDFWNELDDI